MKKLFQRLDNTTSREHNRETNSNTNSNTNNSYVGKVFTVGRYHCTVEDTIAEGIHILITLLFHLFVNLIHFKPIFESISQSIIALIFMTYYYYCYCYSQNVCDFCLKFYIWFKLKIFFFK